MQYPTRRDRSNGRETEPERFDSGDDDKPVKPTREELQRRVSRLLLSSGCGLGFADLEMRIRWACSFGEFLADPAFRGRRGQAFLSRARQDLVDLWECTHNLDTSRIASTDESVAVLPAMEPVASAEAVSPKKAEPEEGRSDGVKPRRPLPISGMISSRFPGL